MASSFGDVIIGLINTCHGLFFFAELSAHYRQDRENNGYDVRAK
jgi:hypothetical protein